MIIVEAWNLSHFLCIILAMSFSCCDHMVVRFTTISAISVYYHKSCKLESRSWQGVLNITSCDKGCRWVVSVWCFLMVLRFPPSIKLTTTISGVANWRTKCRRGGLGCCLKPKYLEFWETNITLGKMMCRQVPTLLIGGYATDNIPLTEVKFCWKWH